MIERRHFLRCAAAGAGSMLIAPRMALATVATERRFLFIIQRGAADGLNILIPYADPAYAGLRRELAMDPATASRLDGSFALHPALRQTAALHAAGQALFVHAIASPYRDRSHFDGQNVLETGGTMPYRMQDGWMNRLVALLPRERAEAIALTPTVPLALRGNAPVTSYAPSGLDTPSDDLMTRLTMLYGRDSQLHPLWSAAMQARELADGTGGKQGPAAIGKLAASFLTKPNGPRIAMLETGGWDTHNAQAVRLNNQLGALDTLLAALRDGMGPAWNNMVVLIATEFGRTAAANGTGGTDHGTASVAMLAGGAVKGGRVIADWPGLGQSQLHEGRDLRPTSSLDALIAGAAAEAMQLDPQLVARALFPQVQGLSPITGLVA